MLFKNKEFMNKTYIFDETPGIVVLRRTLSRSIPKNSLVSDIKVISWNYYWSHLEECAGYPLVRAELGTRRSLHQLHLVHVLQRLLGYGNYRSKNAYLQ